MSWPFSLWYSVQGSAAHSLEEGIWGRQRLQGACKFFLLCGKRVSYGVFCRGGRSKISREGKLPLPSVELWPQEVGPTTVFSTLTWLSPRHGTVTASAWQSEVTKVPALLKGRGPENRKAKEVMKNGEEPAKRGQSCFRTSELLPELLMYESDLQQHVRGLRNSWTGLWKLSWYWDHSLQKVGQNLWPELK